MADTQTSVEQGTDAPSIEDRVANLLGDEFEDAAPAESPAVEAQQDTQEEPSELEADDLPEPEDTTPAESADEFEITYQHQTVKLPKDEVKNLAQLGYHLRQATEKVTGELTAAQERAQAILQTAQAVEQTVPEIQSLRSRMQALQMLADAQNLNPQTIYQVGLTDAEEAQRMRNKLDLLIADYQQADQRLQQLTSAYQQQSKALEQQTVQAELMALQKILPKAKDPAALEKVREQVVSALKGARPETVNAAAKNAEIFAAFAKAAEYDRLVASKKDSLAKASKAPAVMKPGSPNPMDPKVRQSLDLKKEIKRASGTDKVRAIERYLETKI